MENIYEPLLFTKMHKFLFFCTLLFFINFGVKSQQITINEVMSSNDGSFYDDDNDDEDWIELYNYGESAINLGGFSLTDDKDETDKWEFPDFTLQPGAYLLIWASGKNKKDSMSPLHTNFSISADGEALYLFTPDNEEISKIDVPPVPTNYSYGRFPNGTGDWYFYNSPSPKKSNGENGQSNLLSPPTFSTPPGWYSQPTTIELTSSVPEAMILYTLDGSIPDINNLDGEGIPFLINYFHFGEWNESKNISRRNTTYVYTTPLQLSDKTSKDNDLSDIITTYRTDFGHGWKRPQENVFKGQVIRTATYKDGNISPVNTGSFLFHPDKNNRYELPIISLVSSQENLFGHEEGIYVQGKEYFDAGGTEHSYVSVANYYHRGKDWEKQVHLEFFLKNGKLDFSQNLGTRIHGGGSRSKPMKSLRLYGRNEYDSDNEMAYTFLPEASDAFGNTMESYKHLLLRAGGDYMDIYTDAVSQKIMSPAKVDLQDSRPSILLLNGEFWGIINLRERLNDHHISRKYHVKDDNLIILNAPWGNGSESQVETGEPSDISYYRNLYQFAIDKDLSQETNYSYIEEHLDVLSYVDYNIMFIYMNNTDWDGEKHFRYWRTKETSSKPYEDGKWRLMIWDFDASARYQAPASYDFLDNFIHPEGGGEFRPTGDPEKTALLRSLLTNASFRNLFINRFADHINTTFHPDRTARIIQERYQELQPHLEEHFKRWNHHGTNEDRKNELITYFKERPNYQRKHIEDHFNIEEDLKLTLDVSNPNHGFIKCNTIDIKPSTPGIPDQSYPWNGTYFKNIPVTLEAKPMEGFEFHHWAVGEERYNDPTITLSLEENTKALAVFTPTEEQSQRLIHFWHFDKDNVENDVALTQIEASYSLTGSNAVLHFQPVIPYYPPPSGTAGIMDRVNDPTPINYREKGNRGKPYLSNQMRGIRTRNPLVMSGKEAFLVFEIPTNNFKDIILSMAISRTGSGPEKALIEYTMDGEEWISDQLETKEILLEEDFKLVSMDFTSILGANNNKDFKVRLKFSGPTVFGDAGNARFNNVSVDGYLIEDVITDLPSNPEETPGNYLEKIYPNPTNDKLNLKFKGDSHSNIRYMEIINSNGNIINKIDNIPSNQITISTSAFPTGLYTLKIVTNQKIEISKFIKL
ncbi:CotH kinase family protein [Echinicola vietnamensis]|uniref:CotH protein n=1 Tax=Echinicola vietnamensis (strain DSM 17526 / LMG 23754 / KMM 6221) TaxID=926556 RepID=L0FWR8_ECHVK|nr:CotH kinase family protein [Echinicola vietnamensis]AGA77752.1 CotH protein [Echinicola vietnamensis DSM 17526]